MTNPRPIPTNPTHHRGELIGVDLRYFLTATLLHHREPMTIRDLARALHDAGYTVAGRPSKVISDSLRWERAHRRVLRLARGTYRAATRIPRSTLSRIHRRVADLSARKPRPTRTPPLRPPRPLRRHRLYDPRFRLLSAARPAVPPEWLEIERRMGNRIPRPPSPPLPSLLSAPRPWAETAPAAPTTATA